MNPLARDAADLLALARLGDDGAPPAAPPQGSRWPAQSPDPRPAPVSWPLARPKRPVAHVAAQFPQLCEAATQAFGRLPGTPVQHPAAISRSEGTGATHVTAPSLAHSRNNPTESGSISA
jgi:hypothetical protein